MIIGFQEVSGKRKENFFFFFFFAVRGPLTVVASPLAEHRLRTRRLSSHGSRAQPLCGMWDLPRPAARTRVPCIGRRTLNHCATREARQVDS